MDRFATLAMTDFARSPTVAPARFQLRRDGSMKATRERVRAALGGSFVRSLAVLSSAAVIQNALVLAASPILSRLFTPDEFGIAGLIYAIAAMPMTAASAHYYLAVTQTGKRVEWINLVALSLSFISLTCLLAGAVSLVVHFDLLSVGDIAGQLGGLIFFVPGSILLESSLAVGRVWELRQAKYRSLFRNRLIETVSMIATQVLAGVFGVGAIGLILGRILGMGAACFDAYSGIIRSIGRSGRRSLSIGKMKQLARRYWRFPAYTTPAELLASLSRQIPPLFLATYFSVESVGLYWLANRVLERPALLFGREINRVLLQHLAGDQDRGRTRPALLTKTTLILAALALPPFILVIAFGPWIFAVLFGSAWLNAGDYARWMSLVSFAQLIALPSRTAALFNGLQRAQALLEIARALAGAAAIAVAAELTRDEIVSMAAFCVIQSLIVLAFVFITFVVMRRRKRAHADISP
jgi:O-antigen/teichoic acid export membrane protein